MAELLRLPIKRIGDNRHMTDLSGAALERYEPVPVSLPESEVGWRRDGSDTDLRFVAPVGDKMWRRNAVPAGTIPFWSGVGWGTLGLGAGSLTGLLNLAVIQPFMPVVIAGVGAVAFIGGWLGGKRRQRQVRARNAAIEAAGEALSQSYAADFRGAAGAPVRARIRETLRTGEPGSVSTVTGRGHASFRVRVNGDNEIVVSPFERPSSRNSFIDDVVKATAMPITPAAGPKSATLETDERMGQLERRLRVLEKTGAINASHPAYTKLVTLKVDRMTEYRVLAARLAGVKRLNTGQAAETATELERDLDRVVELMRRGVDELEQDVLGDARRNSDAHLDFLQQKYGNLNDAPADTSGSDEAATRGEASRD